jgi:hypothetical protein
MKPQAAMCQTPFSFDIDFSTTYGCYATINVANENLTSFLFVFKLFHVCRYKYFCIFVFLNKRWEDG